MNMGLFFLAFLGIIVFLFSAWVKRVQNNEIKDKSGKKLNTNIKNPTNERVNKTKDLQQIPKSSEDSNDIGSSRK
jgi:hypothetical protein